jgi:hypothetical protein
VVGVKTPQDSVSQAVSRLRCIVAGVWSG